MALNYRPPFGDVIRVATRAVHCVLDVVLMRLVMLMLGEGDEDDGHRHQFIFRDECICTVAMLVGRECCP